VTELCFGVQIKFHDASVLDYRAGLYAIDATSKIM